MKSCVKSSVNENSPSAAVNLEHEHEGGRRVFRMMKLVFFFLQIMDVVIDVVVKQLLLTMIFSQVSQI